MKKRTALTYWKQGDSLKAVFVIANRLCVKLPVYECVKCESIYFEKVEKCLTCTLTKT